MAAQSGGVRMVGVVWLGSNVRVGSFKLAGKTEICTCRLCSLGDLCYSYVNQRNRMLVALVNTLSQMIKVEPGDIKLLAKRESSQDLNVHGASRKILDKTINAWARLLNSPQAPLNLFVTHRSNADLAVNRLLLARDYDKTSVYWKFMDMPLDLRSNVRVVRVAVDLDNRCWDDVGPDLLSNKAFMMHYILKNSKILERAADNLKKDIYVVLAAVEKHGLALQWASIDVRGNKDVVLAAVANNGQALQWASEELRGDKDVVLASVVSNGSVLKWASEKLRGDKDVVLASVTNNGRALQWASIDIRGDKDVVLASVTNNGNALQYASLELRGDRDVVSAAVRSNGQALQWARDDLRKDNDLIFLALETDPTAVKHSDRQHQLEFWAAACLVNGKSFSKMPWTDPARQHTVRLMITKQLASDPERCVS